MEQVITISEKDLDCLRKNVELGKDNFLYHFSIMDPEEQQLAYSNFYKRLLYKLLNDNVVEAVRFYPDKNRIEVRKTIDVSISTGKNDEGEKIVNKNIKLFIIVLILSDINFDGKYLSFRISFPDYYREIDNALKTWGFNRKLMKVNYTVINPQVVTKSYWEERLKKINFSHNHFFNMLEYNEDELLVNCFINFLYQKKLSVIGASTLNYLKHVSESAVLHFPKFAAKSQNERNKILYEATSLSLEWCNGFGANESINLIARITFELLRKEGGTQTIIINGKMMNLVQEKNYSNGDLNWAIYEDPESVIKCRETFHAADLWNLLVNNSFEY